MDTGFHPPIEEDAATDEEVEDMPEEDMPEGDDTSESLMQISTSEETGEGTDDPATDVTTQSSISTGIYIYI